jgi:hypothetical protein
MVILRELQNSVFPEAMDKLKSSKSIPKTNKLYPLDPVILHGLLCIGGRLRKIHSNLSFKHPVILPKESHVTQLILAKAHENACHQGRGITLNQLRSMRYWIVGGSKAVAAFIRQCVNCRKLRRPAETQKMADIPVERVTPTPPFTYCGMDCFGPFTTKQGRKETKRYGLLFTCMCSRAVHIEMLLRCWI